MGQDATKKKTTFKNLISKLLSKSNKPTKPATKLMTAVIMIARYSQKSIASK
jgi:hypothetical protein